MECYNSTVGRSSLLFLSSHIHTTKVRQGPLRGQKLALHIFDLHQAGNGGEEDNLSKGLHVEPKRSHPSKPLTAVVHFRDDPVGHTGKTEPTTRSVYFTDLYIISLWREERKRKRGEGGEERDTVSRWGGSERLHLG